MYYEGYSKRNNNIYNQYNNNEMYLPYTIEQQLKAYAEHPQKTERHEILYHTWYQNKTWLTALLETTIIAYTNYSRHDASHAESVIHNIERILGEERIRMLSPTDCFLLLHIAYIHDIGMYITSKDRENMVESERFDELLNTFERSSDFLQKKWAKCIRRVCYKDETEDTTKLYREKLDVYHAITNILAEFYRSEHGERSSERLTKTSEPLGAGFSMSGIPMRIFFRIAECSALHTSYDFQKILELPREDSGFAHDMMHPRFAAVLLQLGDALDMDNNRFHPLVLNIVGDLPKTSKVHYEKHSSIRTLNITPSEITIEADCETIEALRQIRKECQGIEDLLRVAGYYWSKIMPPNFVGSLPTLNLSKLLCDGLHIPQELVNAKFDISKEKAFHILEGSNVYEDSFPFLREMIQNALDATKLKFWTDYTGSIHYQQNIKGNVDFRETTFDIMKNFSTLEYPIEIYLKIVAVDENNQFVSREEMDRLERLHRKDELDYGVLVEIQDYGIGISKEDIENISKVGESYSKKKISGKMPHILRPTGAFGIGLQSVFAVTPQFKCTSKIQTGEYYEFTFLSPSRKNEGIINTRALSPDQSAPYGTRFEVFVTRDHKIDHHRFLKAWAGVDPFAEEHNTLWKLQEAEELATQMVYYIQEMLGEKIFPISVTVEDAFSEQPPYNLEQLEKNNKTIALTVQTKGKKAEPVAKDRLKKTISWAFQHYEDKPLTKCRDERNNVIGIYSVLPGEDRFYFDLNTFQLKLWCEEVKAFACFSAKRILEAYSGEDKDKNKGKIHFYYKGIEIGFFDGHEEDFGLLESLDFKEEKTAEFLLLNREQLIPKGKDHIYKTIIPKVLESLRKTYIYVWEALLNDSEGSIKESFEKNREKFLEDVQEDLEDFLYRYLFKIVDFSEENTLDMVLKKVAEKSFQKEILESSLTEKKLKDLIKKMKERELWYVDIEDDTLKDFFREVGIHKQSYQSDFVKAFKAFLAELEKERLIFRKDRYVSRCKLSFFQAENIEQQNTQKIASLIFLAYHAKASRFYTKAPEFFCRQGNEKWMCPWNCILICIGKILDEFFGKEIHDRQGVYLSQKVLYVYEITARNIESLTKVNLAEVLSDKDRYYIYSERNDRKTKWIHWFVKVTNEKPEMRDLETLLQKFERPELLYNIYSNIENIQFTNYMGKWMLDNIPTEKLATYLESKDLRSTEITGNRRVNLLSVSSNAEVELNIDIRYLLLKKMQERKKKYKTFCKDRSLC